MFRQTDFHQSILNIGNFNIFKFYTSRFKFGLWMYVSSRDIKRYTS